MVNHQPVAMVFYYRFMEANKRKITDIFNGSRLLKVPFFQRSYVWTEKEWERMLADMLYISEVYGTNEKGYFLGSIILKQEMNPVSQISDVRTIIDGQQRLTTLAIFLKVLYLLNGQDRKFRRKFCLDDDDETVAILHSKNDRADFEAILKLDTLQNIDSDSTIVKAYNYFKENIVPERLDIDAILKNVLFVLIDLNSDEDEQMIFDTINSLGVKLTTGELLKNYFFSENAEDKYNQYWRPNFEADDECLKYWSKTMTAGRLKKDVGETFFYAFLQIKIQDTSLALSSEAKKIYRRTEGLFENYKEIISSKELSKDLIVREICNYARLYRESFNSDILNSDIPAEPSIQRINWIIFAMDASTLLPYVMYVLKNVPAIDERNAIFAYLESYIMRRMLCNTSNNNYSDLFSENLIGQGIKTASDLKEYISSKDADSSLAMPSDDKVRLALHSTIFRNKKALGILYLLESRVRASQMQSTVLRPYSEYTLEHLMPIKWQNNWAAPSSPNTVEQREEMILRLGNMSLLPGKLNSSISNANWLNKKAGNSKHPGLDSYAAGLVTLKNALQEQNWDESTIENRNSELAETAITIWTI